MDSGDTKKDFQSSQPTPPKSNLFWRSVREWIQTIAIAIIIALPIRFFVAEPFIVNGASMDPTFATGQFLVVDRLTYRFDTPNRGDVIVFEYPNNPKLYYIKRIVGLPGETVRIRDGVISIINEEHPDGFALDESYVDPSHRSHDSSSRTLGEEEYFVMGDNRSQSSDSREWGPLDKERIVGRPIVRLLPLTEISVFPGKAEQEK